MWVGKKQAKGITLVEVLATVVVISVLGIFTTKVLFEDLEYRRLNDAVHRAQIIAAAIEYGKDVGLVNPEPDTSRTLGSFMSRYSPNHIERYMPELLNEMAFFDEDPKTFFRVRVSELNTLVTFSTTREHLFGVTIPSAGKTINQNVDDPSITDGINLTVSPLQGRGLFAAYAKERFINQE